MEPALLETDNLLKLSPAEPLWQRVPSRDDAGCLLGDFMMLIPGLNRYPEAEIRQLINRLDKLLSLYQQFIVMADLNLKINILWISHVQKTGIGLEMASAIHTLIPEAKLVAHQYE